MASNDTQLSVKEKKIIFLWVHPRSLSTAFERSILERGDMEVIHEPFGYLYYVHENRPVANMTVDPNHPTTYENIKKMILERARTTTKDYLFVKDMAFHCYNHISNDPDFLRRIKSTFIVRDPLKAVSSHFAMHPNVTCEEIGHEHQWNLSQSIINATGEPPAVVVAEDLEEDAAGVMEAYADKLEIPYNPYATNWQKSYYNLWDTWKEWHVDVANSTGFHKTDRQKHEETIKKNPHLNEFYLHHLPFYNSLCGMRVNRKTMAPQSHSQI